MLKRDIKYKYLTEEELVINLDRLSRFKLPETCFERVFYSVILKCLISPKYSKKELDNISAKEISKTVRLIWNDSVKNLYGVKEPGGYSYNILKFTINNTFKNIPDRIKTFIGTDLKTDEILANLKDDAPLNLKYLKKATEIFKTKEFNLENLKKERETNGLKFPAEKLIIAEGITEEILLPEFAKKLGRNFEKEGIFIIGAGGKSKSPDLYAKIKDKIKIPVIILFDKDAKEIVNTLNKLLDKKDKTILLEKGEFEDIISVNLIKRALNKEYSPATPLTTEELRETERMCKNIENFFRTRHLGEYKKSAVSKILAENIKYDTDISDETKELVNKI